MARLFTDREESAVTIKNQMFLQSSRGAVKVLYDLGREYSYSDNDYEEICSTIKQKSCQVSLLLVREYRFSDNNQKSYVLQANRRAVKEFCCKGSKYSFSDNDYKATISTTKQNSWKVYSLSEKRIPIIS